MNAAAPPRPRGFSLVEMIAALVIFELGVLGVVEVLGTCLRSTSTVVGHSSAVFLAQGLMEETIAEGSFIGGADSGDFGADYPRHSWRRQIADTDKSGLYEITITVSWDERGRQKKYVLTTLAAERL